MRCMGGLEQRLKLTRWGDLMPPQQRAAGKARQHVFRHCDICQKHHLLNHLVGLSHLHHTTVIASVTQH